MYFVSLLFFLLDDKYSRLVSGGGGGLSLGGVLLQLLSSLCALRSGGFMLFAHSMLSVVAVVQLCRTRRDAPQMTAAAQPALIQVKPVPVCVSIVLSLSLSLCVCQYFQNNENKT